MLCQLAKLMPGMLLIVTLAAGMGTTANHLRPDGLPLVRKLLRETRRYTTASELLAKGTEEKKAAQEALPEEPKETSVAPQEPVKEAEQPENPLVTPTPPVGETKPVPKPAEPEKAVVPAAKPEDKPKKKAEALFTTLDDAKSLFDKNSALFIDGRLAIDYEAEHIKGAANLFCEKADELYEKVLRDVPKDRVIVTYCSDPECTEAIKLADKLVEKGHTKVVILLEGLPGWKEAGYPTEKGAK